MGYMIDSGYWEHSVMVKGELYALGYDADHARWVCYSEQERIHWDLNSGVFGYNFTADPKFGGLPASWEMI